MEIFATGYKKIKMTNKLKEVHKIIQEVVDICARKVTEAEKSQQDKDRISYEEGRLYEAQYILQEVENIIYNDND